MEVNLNIAFSKLNLYNKLLTFFLQKKKPEVELSNNVLYFMVAFLSYSKLINSVLF